MKGGTKKAAQVPPSGGGGGMKELLTKYVAYNVWAHQSILDRINKLPEEQILQEITSSFSSIYKTVLHLLDAENIWWQRVKLAEHIERPSDNFTGNFNELQNKLLAQSRLWFEWVNNASEMQLQHVFGYQGKKNEQHKQPVSQTLLHLVNHSTYHRGQLVTMLRQLGHTDIPQTDFSFYTRQSK